MECFPTHRFMVSLDFAVLPVLMVSEHLPDCGLLARQGPCRGPERLRGRREQVTQEMLIELPGLDGCKLGGHTCG